MQNSNRLKNYTAFLFWLSVITVILSVNIVRAAWEPPPADCDPNVNPGACNTPGPIWNASDPRFPAAGQNADINIRGTGVFDNATVRQQSLLQGPTVVSDNFTVNAPSTFTRDIAVNGATIRINGNEVCHEGRNCDLGGGGNGFPPNLQQVTDVGANTTNSINIDAGEAGGVPALSIVSDVANAIFSQVNVPGDSSLVARFINQFSGTEVRIGEYNRIGGHGLVFEQDYGLHAIGGNYGVYSEAEGTGLYASGGREGIYVRGGDYGVKSYAGGIDDRRLDVFGVFAEATGTNHVYGMKSVASGDRDIATPDIITGVQIRSEDGVKTTGLDSVALGSGADNGSQTIGTQTSAAGGISNTGLVSSALGDNRVETMDIAVGVYAAAEKAYQTIGLIASGKEGDDTTLAARFENGDVEIQNDLKVQGKIDVDKNVYVKGVMDALRGVMKSLEAESAFINGNLSVKGMSSFDGDVNARTANISQVLNINGGGGINFEQRLFMRKSALRDTLTVDGGGFESNRFFVRDGAGNTTTLQRNQGLGMLEVTNGINALGTVQGLNLQSFRDLSVARNAVIIGRLTVNGGCVGCADMAESVAFSENLQPGDVVILDQDSVKKVKFSRIPYDKRVAGVISTNPSFIMGDKEKGVPLALIGVVPVKVSSENGAIKVGDMLTTSSVLGHAMKATDKEKSFGAVIGKAMETFSGRTGVIDVLINLQ